MNAKWVKHLRHCYPLVCQALRNMQRTTPTWRQYKREYAKYDLQVRGQHVVTGSRADGVLGMKTWGQIL